jgi:hypothetical protein
MASISERCRAAMKTALIVPEMALVPAARVYRAREDAFSPDEEDSINIKGADESTAKMGRGADRNEEAVDVDIYVRAAQGEVWETKADAIMVEAHARLAAYTAWPPGFAEIRKIGARFGGAERAERTPGILTVRYQIWFQTSAQALDKTPYQP